MKTRFLSLLLIFTVGCAGTKEFITSDFGQAISGILIEELLGRHLEAGESATVAEISALVAAGEAEEEAWLTVLFIGAREATEQALILYADEHSEDSVDEFTVNILQFVTDEAIPLLEEEADEFIIERLGFIFDEALSQDSASLLKLLLASTLEFESAGEYLGDRDEGRIRCVLSGILWGTGWEDDAESVGCDLMENPAAIEL